MVEVRSALLLGRVEIQFVVFCPAGLAKLPYLLCCRSQVFFEVFIFELYGVSIPNGVDVLCRNAAFIFIKMAVRVVG